MFSEKNLQTTQTICQVFSCIFTCIAATTVGGWALYNSLYVKQEKEIANYTLIELKQKTEQDPHVQVELTTETQKIQGEQNLLQVNIRLFNQGSKDARVILDEHSIQLIPTSFKDGHAQFAEGISLYDGRYKGSPRRRVGDWVDIGVGESYELKFVHAIAVPGTYLIRFMALNDIPGPTPPGSTGKSIFQYKYSVGADSYVTVQ